MTLTPMRAAVSQQRTALVLTHLLETWDRAFLRKDMEAVMRSKKLQAY